MRFLLEMTLMIQTKKLLNGKIKNLIKFIRDLKVMNFYELLNQIIMKLKK